MNNLFNRTYNEAENLYLSGGISAKEWGRYLFVWSWGAPRFSGVAGLKQEAYWNKRGKSAYLRRMNRVRHVLGLSLYPLN